MAAKQKKRTSPLTIVVILLLLTLVGVQLLRMQDKIEAAENEQSGLEEQLAAQRQENASLEAALDKADDPEYLQDLARDQLGYVTPGEKDFYDVSNSSAATKRLTPFRCFFISSAPQKKDRCRRAAAKAGGILESFRCL